MTEFNQIPPQSHNIQRHEPEGIKNKEDEQRTDKLKKAPKEPGLIKQMTKKKLPSLPTVKKTSMYKKASNFGQSISKFVKKDEEIETDDETKKAPKKAPKKSVSSIIKYTQASKEFKSILSSSESKFLASSERTDVKDFANTPIGDYFNQWAVQPTKEEADNYKSSLKMRKKNFKSLPEDWKQTFKDYQNLLKNYDIDNPRYQKMFDLEETFLEKLEKNEVGNDLINEIKEMQKTPLNLSEGLRVRVDSMRAKFEKSVLDHVTDESIKNEAKTVFDKLLLGNILKVPPISDKYLVLSKIRSVNLAMKQYEQTDDDETKTKLCDSIMEDLNVLSEEVGDPYFFKIQTENPRAIKEKAMELASEYKQKVIEQYGEDPEIKSYVDALLDEYKSKAQDPEIAKEEDLINCMNSCATGAENKCIASNNNLIPGKIDLKDKFTQSFIKKLKHAKIHKQIANELINSLDKDVQALRNEATRCKESGTTDQNILNALITQKNEISKKIALITTLNSNANKNKEFTHQMYELDNIPMPVRDSRTLKYKFISSSSNSPPNVL